MKNEIIISSEIKNLIIAENLVETLSNEYHINEDLYGNMLISLMEALNNAIVHGNKLDANRNVTIRYEKCQDKLIFTISDEGNGFDYKAIPDPTIPENIEKIDGRGIFLMMNLADSVKFFRNGSEVELNFNLY